MHLKRVCTVFIAVLTCLSCGLATISPASAENQRVRVRGTVIKLNDKTLTVKTREGDTVDVAMVDDWKVAGMVKVSLADIKPGDFVGIASLPKAGGGDGALEVLVFPPALKGTGEGSYGWDLKPGSSMTNATVAEVTKTSDGPNITVTWKGSQKTIAIPEGTPIVTFGPATASDLQPGKAIFISGEKSPAGVISTKRVTVEANGVLPPM